MTETTNNEKLMSENVQEKAYTMRELEATDLFVVSTILSKIGIHRIKDCFQSPDVKKVIADMANGENDNTAVAEAAGMTVVFDILSLILSNLESCEEDIYKLLARLTGSDKAKIKRLPAATFGEMVVEVIRKKEFRDFFKVVSGLFK